MKASTRRAGARGETGLAEPAAGTPGVVFGDGRRPESATRVSLGEWEGPLGLLVSLIETRQLDILRVPLGSLAAAYLDALASLESDRLGNISAFVSVASELILIKSRALLPRQEEALPGRLPDEGPDPEAELRARLLLYRAFRDAGGRLQAIALERIGLFTRDPSAALAAGVAGARPAEAPPLDPALLPGALAGLARLAPLPPPPPETLPRTVTLTERAEIIRAAIRGAGTIVLQELLRGVRDRVVVTVTFLALLELVKRREIVVEQAEPWGPIVVRASSDLERVGSAGGAIAADPPFDETLETYS